MESLQPRLRSLSTGRDQATAVALVLALVAALILPGPAAADMYTVSGVAIEATGESAAAAKSVAIAGGQAKAFADLMQRLLRPEDAARVPPPEPTVLQSVVAGYSLDNERTGPTQYLADLTVRFNGDAVELLLSRYGIRMAVEQASPALVVPVTWIGGRGVIWEADNPWRAVWERIDLDNRLVPALLPLGDATDASVDSDLLARADLGALDVLRGRYGVELAFVSLFAHDPASGRMEASLTGQGPGGPIDLREQTTAEKGHEAEAMETLATALLDRLDREWRIALATDPANRSQTIALGVPLGNLQEWVGIRTRLEAAPGVDKVDVRTLNAGGAQVDVTFTGGFRELAAALEYQGLSLYDNGTNWIVRAN